MEKTIINEMFEEFYNKALPKNNMLSKEALEALFYATLAFNSSYMRMVVKKGPLETMTTLATIDKELSEHINGRINEHKKTQQN